MSNATELLSRALKFLDYRRIGSDTLEKDIKTFLATEPEADGPVGYVYTDFESGMKQGAIDDHSLANGTPLYTRPEPEAEPDTWQSLTDDEVWEISKQNADDYEYFRAIEEKLKEKNHPPKPEPAIRKPMTEEEMDVGFNPYRMRWLADDQYFVAGVRFAEKHHGIGGDE